VACRKAEKTAFMEPASAKFGVPIVNTSPISYAKVKAMVEANAVEWDLVDVGGQFIYQGRDQGLLEKIDFSIVDVSKLDKYWVSEYGVFTSTGATVIAYNTKAFPEGKGPQSWKDFWDVKAFPGPRTLYNASTTTTKPRCSPTASSATRSTRDRGEGEARLRQARRDQAAREGVVVDRGADAAAAVDRRSRLGSAWSGRVLDAMKEKAPVSFTYKDAVAWGNAYVVPKGTPHKELAMKVLNYSISEEAQLRLLPLATYGPVLASAAAKATPEQAMLYVTHPTNIKDACIFNDEEVAKYVTRYEDEWRKFQLA